MANLTPLTRPAFNREMKKFAEQMAGYTMARGRSLMVGTSPRATGDGMRSIAPKVGYYQGEVERLAVTFRRHLIYAHHGVGRGRKINTSGARPRNFLSSGIDRYHQQVADVAMRYYGDDLATNHDKVLTRAYQGTSIRITRS